MSRVNVVSALGLITVVLLVLGRLVASPVAQMTISVAAITAFVILFCLAVIEIRCTTRDIKLRVIQSRNNSAEQVLYTQQVMAKLDHACAEYQDAHNIFMATMAQLAERQLPDGDEN